MISLNEKIKASIYLLSYFETLGFNNTQWEFNYGNGNIEDKGNAGYIWLNIIHHFFSLGGFSNIDLTNWNCSDDTIMMISTGLGCLRGTNEKNYIDEYIKILPELKNEKRQSGFNTLNTLELIKRLQTIDKLEYKENMGGNGAAMRTSIIGLIYYKEEDIDILIENSIIASRVTHNYSLGYLSGLITALFTSYAIRDISVWDWIDNLLDLYESNKIDNYMKKTNIYQKYLEEKDDFFDKWYQYKEQKLSKFKYKPFDFLHYDNRIDSLDDYNEYKGKGQKNNYTRFGGSGLSALIVAYDSLLMSYSSTNIPLNLKDKKSIKFSIDSLIFFSTLHFGDNDTTGAIAGAWYGALYGFSQFNTNRLEQLELKNELNKITNKVIKYHKLN